MRVRTLLWAAACAFVTCHAPAAGPLESESVAAKKLYTSKCARCHKFYEPSAYGGDEWRMWMSKMRKKARLESNDYELLLRYTERLRLEVKTGAK